MSIYDIHTHHHPDVSGSAIVQLMSDAFIPFSGHCYSVGLHPWYIADDWRVQMAKLAVVALHPQVVMIGETGMDKKNGAVSLEVQMEVFCEHVRISEILRKPLLIHCVKAIDELLALRKGTKATMPWVLHGFRGGVEQWRQLSRAGIFVSLGDLFDADLAQQLPLSDLLFESDDSPSIDAVYTRVACCRGIDADTLRDHVGRNISRVLESWRTLPF